MVLSKGGLSLPHAVTPFLWAGVGATASVSAVLDGNNCDKLGLRQNWNKQMIRADNGGTGLPLMNEVANVASWGGWQPRASPVTCIKPQGHW